MVIFTSGEEIILSYGLRNILPPDYPRTWGQAAKANVEFKGLNNLKGALCSKLIEHRDRIMQTYFKTLMES